MRPTLRAFSALSLEKVTLSAPSAYVRARGGRATPALDADFALFPAYYTAAESRILLQAALWKLDRGDYTRRRRRRAAPKEELKGEGQNMLQDLFNGEYGFEEGHFDSVIHTYRESLFSSLPPTPELAPVLARLYSLVPGLEVPEDVSMSDLPPPKSSTHVLHLAPGGAILPHVDNLDASGQTIVGASLGATRVLRLEHQDTGEGWDVLLPSGSVYIQKGEVRYTYKHSILGYDADGSEWDGQKLVPGHRVSFMVRDAPTGPPAQL